MRRPRDHEDKEEEEEEEEEGEVREGTFMAKVKSKSMLHHSLGRGAGG